MLKINARKAERWIESTARALTVLLGVFFVLCVTVNVICAFKDCHEDTWIPSIMERLKR